MCLGFIVFIARPHHFSTKPTTGRTESGSGVVAERSKAGDL